jgi:hypothetical protein
MGNLQAKSERKAFKELVRKNTKFNRNNSTPTISDLRTLGTSSPSLLKSRSGSNTGGGLALVDNRVSFSTHVKQLEYDMDIPTGRLSIGLLQDQTDTSSCFDMWPNKKDSSDDSDDIERCEEDDDNLVGFTDV